MAPTQEEPKKATRVEFRKTAIAFVSGAVAGGVVKTATAPMSRSTILLQTATNEALLVGGQAGAARAAMATNSASSSSSYYAWLRRSVAYLGQVRSAEGVLSFWKGNGASILMKMVTTGSNYVIYDVLKSWLRPYWASDTDVGFKARLCAGVCAGAFNITVAYPLDLARTNIAAAAAAKLATTNAAAATPVVRRKPTTSEWASIWPTLRGIRDAHGWTGFTRGLVCTQLCQGLNVGLHFGVYETMVTTSNRLFAGVKNKKGERAPRASFFHSYACGAVAGLVASCVTQPLDLVRRRQQLAGGAYGDKWFFQVAFDVVKRHGLGGLYRGLAPELVKVCLFPASGLNFFVYEFVRQDIFGEKSGVR